jgi:hypothetical protein
MFLFVFDLDCTLIGDVNIVAKLCQYMDMTDTGRNVFHQRNILLKELCSGLLRPGVDRLLMYLWD